MDLLKVIRSLIRIHLVLAAIIDRAVLHCSVLINGVRRIGSGSAERICHARAVACVVQVICHSVGYSLWSAGGHPCGQGEKIVHSFFFCRVLGRWHLVRVGCLGFYRRIVIDGAEFAIKIIIKLVLFVARTRHGVKPPNRIIAVGFKPKSVGVVLQLYFPSPV